MTKISLIGLPTDSNSSFERGAAAGPDAIRDALWSDRGNMACEYGLEACVDFGLDDRGDISLSSSAEANSAEQDDRLIDGAITSEHSDGRIPVFLGGDHSVTFPIIQSLAALHGPVSILHFDAHPDLYDNFEGNPRSHASPFARIMEAGLAKRLVQIGIRTLNGHCREQAKRFGVEIIAMRDFDSATAPILEGPLYISFDLDGLDPSEAPGVAHPEPGGLTMREALRVIHAQSAPIIGADIVELNPSRDVNQVTAIAAAKLIREIGSRIHLNINCQ